MSSACCFVVPPYLLQAIAASEHNPESVRSAAHRALSLREAVTEHRKTRFAALCQPRGYLGVHNTAPQGIVPTVLLQHIADSPDVDDKTRACAKRDLEHMQKVHQKVLESQSVAQSSEQKTLAAAGKDKPKDPEAIYRAIYDMKHSSNEMGLPGTIVRAEGQPAGKDKAVNDAFDNVGLVLAMYKEHFDWNSIDNKGMHVISSVHFGDNYENAFWEPEKMQMVFGDGDEFLNNFTGCVDVIGHEMTHAVTEHTSPLDYQGQSGALNESFSDCMGIMIKQKLENEKAEDADWLIGENCIVPGVKGVALRSMKAPGTAYNDPRFGKDPQPDNFKDYKTTWEDNGGVHIYSGIPNKAFYLTAKAFGGYTWEKAGQIWWKTMTSGRIPPRCTFLQFADVTVDIAEELYDEEAGNIVQAAWKEVGVVRKR